MLVGSVDLTAHPYRLRGPERAVDLARVHMDRERPGMQVQLQLDVAGSNSSV